MVRYGALTAALGLLGLASCGGSKEQTPAAKTAAADAPAKPAVFAACASCHSISAGQHGIGPSLAGVFGRKAGSVPGFVYSAALKGSGKVWDEATLDNFLISPMAAVPGTHMTYMGQSDPAKRKIVIEYLKTL